MNRDEFRRTIISAIKQLLAPIHVMLNEYEIWWVEGLAMQAEGFASRILTRGQANWRLFDLISEGLRWYVRVDWSKVHSAAMRALRDEAPTVPKMSELREGMKSAEEWGFVYERYIDDLWLAYFTNKMEGMETFKSLVENPIYIRLPSGWRSIEELHRELLEAREKAGPRSMATKSLCRDIIRTLPPPVTLPNGRPVDLGPLAASLLRLMGD